MADPTDSPFWRDPDLGLHDDARTRCLDVAGGLDGLRKKPDVYLPKLPRETWQNYEVRKTLAELVNLYMGAVRSASGLLIAKPPALNQDAPRELEPILQDIDGQQTGLAVWTRGVVEHMLQGGCVLAMVSTPVRTGNRPTRAQEQAQALRPYVALYRPADVLGAHFVRIGAQLVLQEIRLRETVTQRKGRYGTEKVEQVRVVTRRWRGSHMVTVFRKDERGREVQFGDVTIIETDEIPCVEFSVDPNAGFMKAAPPLVDLADMTISHYRILNDRRWSLKQSCFPWPVRINYRETEGVTTASVTEVMDLPSGGDFKFAAPPGTAFEPTRADLDDIERRAASASLSFLAGETDGPQRTATAASIDQQGQDASLASVAVCLRDSLNRLGAVIDEMLGNEPRDLYFDVQTTFRGLRRDPTFLAVLFKAWQAGGLSLEALLYAFKNGQLPEEFDAEREAIDLMVAAEAAAAEAEAAARDQQGQTGDGGQQDPVDDQPVAA
jgi:Domain of unknown function (DUF4055)